MSPEPDPDAAARGLAERQARAWERGDGDLAVADWHTDGVLVAPGARVEAAGLPAEIARFHDEYEHLEVAITNVFADRGGRRVAIEWDWTVTRRSDGRRTCTKDAILVDLEDGRIRAWREYFDPAATTPVDVPTPSLPRPGAGLS